MFFNGLTPRLEDCCGCSACEQICPRQAITMSDNKDGFIYPILDPSLCVECSLCESVCPMINSEFAKSKEGEVEAYAAISKDSKTRSESSSGGVFSLISSYILDLNGVIYGAAFDEDMQLYHIGIERKDELCKLRGSKYFQSNNKSVYSEIKKHLKSGRWVYYTGTGCQVAGLKSFLRKPYATLVTSDLICHGTPSHKIFDFFKAEIEKKYKGKIVSYQFRDKSVNGWSCSSSSSSIKINDKTKYIGIDSLMTSYFNLFITGAMNRESCYHCPFTTVERTGDITLADYWGVKKYHNIKDRYKGVSAILVNTPLGKEIINNLKEQLLLISTDIDWIADENTNLKEKTERTASRTGFYERFTQDPYAIIDKFKPNITSYIRYYILKAIVSVPFLHRTLRNLKN